MLLNHIPKQELVPALETLLRPGGPQLAADCPQVDSLIKQGASASPAVATPPPSKPSGCDDLVMALAMPAGYACRIRTCRAEFDLIHSHYVATKLAP